MRARRHIGVLVRHDLRYSLSSARGLLFLFAFALLWGWIFSRFAGGDAENLGTPQASFFLSWVFDSHVLRLFQERPPTLSAYFVLGAMLTPLFAMLSSCDQTATDLGTRHIRFLIPRVGRAEIFIARFIGSAILISAAQLLAGVTATIVALAVSNGADSADIILYGAQITAVLIIYSLPFVALMSLVSAVMASVGLALLVGLAGYLIIVAIVAALPSKGAAGTVGAIISFVIPSGLKPHMLQPEVGPSLLAAAGTFLYVAAYGALGWQVFRTRDA